MFKSDNSFGVFIGKSISRTASVQAVDNSNSTTFLANGEVLILDKDFAPLTAGKTVADSEYIYVVQRSGATASTSQVLRSNKIYGSNVTSYSGLSYVAPAEQISYVGYNGTTGNIEAIKLWHQLYGDFIPTERRIVDGDLGNVDNKTLDQIYRLLEAGGPEGKGAKVH